MPIKFLAGTSSGAAFETYETRTVNVTAEALDVSVGYEGDSVQYTATVLDSIVEKLPAAFVATLKINGTDLVASQVFDVSVYDQATGLLTLDFMVPAAPIGALTVTLDWAEQII